MVGLDSDPQPQQPTLLFNKGEQVEVSSDEDGFRGAWYLASILDSPPKSTSKKNKKVLVEYKTLLTEDGSSPLTEYVDPAHIRPSPPLPDDSAIGSFKENDVVDAGYSDGWWTGIVRKILEGSRYRVYFDNPPDIIDFDVKDLRAHWEWVNGEWIRPEKPQAAWSDFSSGTTVEVNVDEENACDTWSPAVVVKENGDKTFFVKCQSSRNDDEAGMLKITVDSLHIRPTPPHYVDWNYELLEKVETRYEFGWRAGVITKLLAGRRYNVFFKQGNEDKELDHSEIRPHFEWLDGKWIIKSQESLIGSDMQEQLGDTQNYNESPEMALELESSAKDNTAEETPCSPKVSSEMEHSTTCDEKLPYHSLPPSNKKLKLTAPNGNGLCSCPSKRLILKDAAKLPLSVMPLQSKKMPDEMSTGLTLDGFGTPKPASKRPGFSTTSVLVDQLPARTESLSTGRIPNKKRLKVVEFDLQKVSVRTRKGRLIKSPIKTPSDLAAVKERNVVDAAAGLDIQESEGKTTESEVPVIVGLEAKGVIGPGSDNPHQESDKGTLKHKRDEKNLNYSIQEQSVELNLLKDGGGGSQRRKRGRPRKVVFAGPKASEAGNKDHVAGHEVAVKDHTSIGSDLPTQLVVERKVAQNASREKATEFSETDRMTKEFDKAVAGVPNNLADDDRPLSTWFEGIHSSNFEDSRLSSGKSAHGLNETRERRIIPVKSCAINGKDKSMLTGNQIIPFIKRSPVWKTIETIEVFQIMPQNPHFHPLSECKEEYREGSAIGIMVTFASLFEKICSLQFGDSRSVFESTLESLADLEKHGFDVVKQRDRVNELLSIKDMQADLLNESKDAEMQIREHIDEKRELDEVVNNIEKKITELLQELAASKAKVEAKDLEISKSQSHADAVNGLINNVRHDFEKLATASWKFP